MEDLLHVLASLAGLALYPLIAFGVVSLARRRPWIAAALLSVVVVGGAAAVWYAYGVGFGYRHELGRVEYGSEEGRLCFGVGYVLLTLGCPAWLLVAVARTQNGTALGPHGPQWVAVLFGYWLACFIFGAALYSWLTGHIK